MTRLVDLLSNGGSIMTGPFGTKLKASEYGSDGVPVISVGEVGYGRFKLRDETPLAPEDVVARLPEFILQEGDIVFARKGAVDRSARVGQDESGWFLGSDGLRVRPPESISSRWLSYYFQLPSSRSWLLRHAAGTTMLSLSGAVLGEMPINVPHLRDQEAIAAVLGALDDKIAANTAIMHTADELAATRFSQVVEDASGLVTLGELCEVNARTIKPGSGRIRYLDIASLAKGRIPRPTEMDWSDAPSRARRQIRPGDVVWATVRPNREQYFLNLIDDDSLIGSTGLAVLSPTSVPWSYLYEIARQRSFVDQIVASAEGSAYPAVRPERFLHVSVPIASADRVKAFDEFATPVRIYLQALAEENAILAELRDTLLPALMSGRLRVKDAEKQIEDAV